MMDKCQIKFIALGESGVGKTSLIRRFANKTDLIKPTIIIDIFKVDIQIQDIKVNIAVWDTTGQETFREIAKSYLHAIDGVLLVYDITNLPSFLKLSSWLQELKSQKDNAICFIVGNKIDNPNSNAEWMTQVKTFAEEENLELHYCSAKTGENVNEIFERLALQVLQQKQIIEPHPGEESESTELATCNVIAPKSSWTKRRFGYYTSMILIPLAIIVVIIASKP